MAFVTLDDLAGLGAFGDYEWLQGELDRAKGIAAKTGNVDGAKQTADQAFRLFTGAGYNPGAGSAKAQIYAMGFALYQQALSYIETFRKGASLLAQQSQSATGAIQEYHAAPEQQAAYAREREQQALDLKIAAESPIIASLPGGLTAIKAFDWVKSAVSFVAPSAPSMSIPPRGAIPSSQGVVTSTPAEPASTPAPSAPSAVATPTLTRGPSIAAPPPRQAPPEPGIFEVASGIFSKATSAFASTFKPGDLSTQERERRQITYTPFQVAAPRSNLPLILGVSAVLGIAAVGAGVYLLSKSDTKAR